jgi:hypothetical protein
MVEALISDVLLGSRKFEPQRCAVAGVHHDVDVALGLAELTVGGVVSPFHHRRIHVEMAMHASGVGINRSSRP